MDNRQKKPRSWRAPQRLLLLKEKIMHRFQDCPIMVRAVLEDRWKLYVYWVDSLLQPDTLSDICMINQESQYMVIRGKPTPDDPEPIIRLRLYSYDLVTSLVECHLRNHLQAKGELERHMPQLCPKGAEYNDRLLWAVADQIFTEVGRQVRQHDFYLGCPVRINKDKHTTYSMPIYNIQRREAAIYVYPKQTITLCHRGKCFDISMGNQQYLNIIRDLILNWCKPT